MIWFFTAHLTLDAFVRYLFWGEVALVRYSARGGRAVKSTVKFQTEPYCTVRYVSVSETDLLMFLAGADRYCMLTNLINLFIKERISFLSSCSTRKWVMGSFRLYFGHFLGLKLRRCFPARLSLVRSLSSTHNSFFSPTFWSVSSNKIILKKDQHRAFL